MAEPVHAVLMAGGVPRDPLLVGAVAQHAEDDTTAAGSLHDSSGLRLVELAGRAVLDRTAGGGCPHIKAG